MTKNEIEEILKLVDQAKLHELELETENLKIKIKRTSDPLGIQVLPPVSYYQAPVSQNVALPSAPPAPTTAQEPKEVQPAAPSNTKMVEIKSPMTGTFYSSPSPDKPAFVASGTAINPGQPICIIEAMKLFNEIEAEVGGTIDKILVKDGQSVDYDQPLFLVRT